MMSAKRIQITVPVLSLASALLVSISSCTKDKGKPKAEATAAIQCDSITYTRHIGPLVNAKCISCHQPGTVNGGHILTTYELVKNIGANGKLENVIFKGVPAFMPYGSELPEHEKELIRCWLNNGMKQ